MIDFDRYQTIAHVRRGRVLELTLNRPQQLNAIDARMHAELAQLFIDIADDPGCDVAVLGGAGRAFCAGGDIGWMQRMIDDGFDQVAREARRIVLSLLDCDKPVIAKVNGHATGLGATIALFCDVVFAAEHASISDPHVCVGLTAGDGGALIWPQLIGYARAKEYLLTGDPIGAVDAARIGLINHAVPAAELDARVAAFADRLAGGAAQAIRSTKATVNLGLKRLAHDILDIGLAHEARCSASADHQAAVTAFAQRRKPVFGGA